ncbi:BA75_03407T0 [Komagataella pastoris]|uniref:Serine/threonine-protein kinase RAD53 n=1 Tax=Komagataella pastoris TaxID=4922 RepID=A0A1B2JH80_PICPA|nr:BA75_03407T0 [Komagataella pastoris]
MLQTQQQTQATQPSAPESSYNIPEELLNREIICRLICTTASGESKYFDLCTSVKSKSSQGIYEWIFGRNTKVCDFKLPSSSSRLSNVHFKIWFNGNKEELALDHLMIQDVSTNGTYVNNCKLVKGTNNILTQGDEISVGIGVPVDVIRYIVVLPKVYSLALHDSLHRKKKEEGVHCDFFIKDEVVGSGAFATVKKAIERSTGDTYAVKIISKKKAMTDGLDGVQRELEILKKLHHPGVVQLKSFYEDSDNFYLVMEYVAGGDLMDFVAAYGSVGESAGREITRQILEALDYVHALGISHRDLKPDNILIVQDDPVKVKITDFGLAKVADQGSVMKTFCGTLAYLAPEVLSARYGITNQFMNKDEAIKKHITKKSRESYSSKVDMWSIGCLVYVILTAHLPFSGSTQDSLTRNILEGNYHYSLLKENGISNKAKDFLDKLLNVDPTTRLGVKQALNHPWISELSDESQVSLSQSQSHQRRIESQESHSFITGMNADAYERIEEADEADEQCEEQGEGKPHKAHDSKVQLTNKASFFVSKEISTSVIENSVSLSASFNQKQSNKNSVVSKQLESPQGTFITLNLLENSVSKFGTIHIPQGKTPFVVGRDLSCDWSIKEERISKIHCMIAKKRHPTANPSIFESPALGLEDIWLLDFSTNSCFVNDIKVGKNHKTQIFHGDEICLFKDAQKREQLVYRVQIDDGTGLFQGGERTQDNADDILDIDEVDEKLKELLIRAPRKRYITPALETPDKRAKRAHLNSITENS